jgi:hypothetical protein
LVSYRKESTQIRAFDGRELRRILGPEGEGVTRRQRKVKKDVIGGRVVCKAEMRNPYTILIGIPAGSRPFGRHRCRREDDIKIGLTLNVVRICSGIKWLRTGPNGGLL